VTGVQTCALPISLYYQATTLSTVTTNIVDCDATTATFRLKRILNNASGGTMTINEIGWYGYWTNTPYYICYVRRVLPSPVTLLNGESRTISILFKITT
jgi:hypothetical protein